MSNSTSSHATGSAAILSVPVQTTFRHMSTSPAVAALVEDEARNLGRFFDGITHCHVVIASPHKHHLHGRRFSVHIDLGVPHGPIVVTHEPAERGRLLESARHAKAADASHAQEDLYAVVRDAFATARRQLDHYVRRLRGNLKDSFVP